MKTLSFIYLYSYKEMRFDFFIGGYFGTNQKVVKDGNDLLCYESLYPVDQSEVSRISLLNNPKWERIVEFLQICDWRNEYVEEGVCDGTQWTLNANDSDIQLDCYGSNAYPSNFKAFVDLLNSLMTSHDFEISFVENDF